MRDGRGWVLRELACVRKGERGKSEKCGKLFSCCSSFKRTVKFGRWFENSQRGGRLDERHSRKAYFRTWQRCPQGPDLAFTKPTRDLFNLLHSSFQRTKSFFSENNLQHIAEDIFFPSFTTLHVERFFARMRTPSRPTSDM